MPKVKERPAARLEHVNDYEPYADALSKQDELGRQLTAARQRVEKILLARSREGRDFEANRRAGELLGEASPGTSDQDTDLDAARLELSALEKAHATLAERRQAAYRETCILIAEELRPAHQAIARNVNDAVLALAELMRRGDLEIQRELQSRGAQVPGETLCPLVDLGLQRTEHGTPSRLLLLFRAWQLRLVAGGYLLPDDVIPEYE